MVAETYEKMRPGYSAELYDDIFKMIALNESCKLKLNSFQYF